ncbi:MAG: AAA family ATPase [Gammaproteobacteria bacterium]
MTFSKDLKIHLQAGVPAIYVETAEWLRFEGVLGDCCEGIGKKWQSWNQFEGITLRDSEKASENTSGDGEHKVFSSLLKYLSKEGDTVTVLEFADRYFDDADAQREFAVMLRYLRGKKSTVIIVSPTLNMPPAVQSEFAVLDFPLPKREDIRKSLKKIAKDFGIPSDRIDPAGQILDSVRGLGTTEIWNAFAKVAVQHQKITAKEIPSLIAEKEQIIRKSGYLEFIRPDTEMSAIGGLDGLKEWLKTRKIAFGSGARKLHLDAPKGVLLLGIPGTGKSLCAKAVSAEWQMPLLRLDVGRIFGGLVGESESNMRNAIKTAESLEPCVLWIDEIEKGLSGGAGGERDGGTSARVFGSLLTWMQEKQGEVFVFATANDVGRIPPELLRKGRFDEIFFVDLPDEKSRRDIFEIHLKRRGQRRAPSDELLKATAGFSGAEIEAIVKEALFLAHREKRGKGGTITVSAQNLIAAKGEMVPLSTTMREAIANLRQWAKNRCRLANTGIPPNIGADRDSPRLRQEIVNPFSEKSND